MMVTTLALETRPKKQVENELDLMEPIIGHVEQAASFKNKFLAAVHRPTNVCYSYNCHGLTFASRRTAITAPAQIRAILVEDGYQLVRDIREVLPGDIAIYVDSSGDIDHSGIVVEVPKNTMVVNPRILSKWGSAHEVVHFYRDCPYSPSSVEFYRMVK